MAKKPKQDEIDLLQHYVDAAPLCNGRENGDICIDVEKYTGVSCYITTTLISRLKRQHAVRNTTGLVIHALRMGWVR